MQNLLLQQRAMVLIAIVRLLLNLIRTLGLGIDLESISKPDRRKKTLRAIETASEILAKKAALAIVGLSPARYYRLRRQEE